MLPQFNPNLLKGVVAEYQHLTNNVQDHVEFMGYLGNCGFTAPFDWMAWTETVGDHWDSDTSLIDNADIDTLRKLVVAHQRIERTSEGHLEHLFDTGYMDKIFKRVEQLTP